MGCLDHVSQRSWLTNKSSARTGPGWVRSCQLAGHLDTAWGRGRSSTLSAAVFNRCQQQQQRNQPPHVVGPRKQWRLAPTWDSPEVSNANVVNKNQKVCPPEWHYIIKELSLVQKWPVTVVSPVVLSHLQSDGWGVMSEQCSLAPVPPSLCLHSRVPHEQTRDVHVAASETLGTFPLDSDFIPIHSPWLIGRGGALSSVPTG